MECRRRSRKTPPRVPLAQASSLQRSSANHDQQSSTSCVELELELELDQRIGDARHVPLHLDAVHIHLADVRRRPHVRPAARADRPADAHHPPPGLVQPHPRGLRPRNEPVHFGLQPGQEFLPLGRAELAGVLNVRAGREMVPFGRDQRAPRRRHRRVQQVARRVQPRQLLPPRRVNRARYARSDRQRRVGAAGAFVPDHSAGLVEPDHRAHCERRPAVARPEHARVCWLAAALRVKARLVKSDRPAIAIGSRRHGQHASVRMEQVGVIKPQRSGRAGSGCLGAAGKLGSGSDRGDGAAGAAGSGMAADTGGERTSAMMPSNTRIESMAEVTAPARLARERRGWGLPYRSKDVAKHHTRPLAWDGLLHASTLGIGGVLTQKDDDGRERVVAYYGRALQAAEKNWTVTEIELLAACRSRIHPSLEAVLVGPSIQASD
eukprot:scaffold4986_cov117-Isochrysis_galbana.AAC.4